MKYGKLPIIFLSTIASENDGTTNCQIANYILGNIEAIKKYTISDLAKSCHVANSSISRFCREIGLDDFTELKELINNNSMEFQTYSDAETTKQRAVEFSKNTIQSLENAVNTVNYSAIDELVKDIDIYDNIAVFGLLKAQTVAMNLQSDLLMLGKVVTSKLPFKEQVEYLNTASKDQLVIIFSYKGIYFDYWYPKRIPKYSSKPKIYFITSNKDVKENEYFDRVIHFDSLQDYASHPFQLQLIGSIIAQSYAYYLKKRE